MRYISKIFPIVSFCLTLTVYALFLLRPPILVTSDLGRHVANGREIMRGNMQVLFTNTYSFVFPDKPTINHHWLTGIVFYVVQQLAGFGGLHVAHVLLLLVTFILFFIHIKNLSSWYVALLLCLPAALLLGGRTEIRPESFGYFGIVLFSLIFNQTWKSQAINWRQALLLLITQVLWVNLHISFIFGIFLAAVYAGTALIFHRYSVFFYAPPVNKKLLQQYVALTVAFCCLSLLNPSGIAGALVPFQIFSDYGYPVVENQNLLFLQQRYPQPSILLYMAMLLLTVCIAVATFMLKVVAKNSSLLQPQHWLLGFAGFVLGFLALRNIPLMVFFSFPLIAVLLHALLRKLRAHMEIEQPQLTAQGIILGLTLSLVLFVGTGKYNQSVSFNEVKIGVYERESAVASAYLAAGSPEPIFNNYDIGSALIYWLYPSTKVFVDNRPEAYTADFFQQTYIPMQEQDSVWQEQLQQHNFQAILFGVNDITPWGQTFLRARLKDPQWKTAYRDEFAILFVRAESSALQ